MCVCSGPVLIAGRLPWWFREVSATVCTDQRVFRDIERFLCVVPVEIMAGNYFYDPRPFYGMNNYNLVPLDEVFYGRDPWFMQQQRPYGYYEDPRPRSRSVEHRRPGEYIHSADQFREYRRPDMRDDTYTNYHQGYDNRQQNGRGNEMHGNKGQKNSNGGGKNGNHDNNSMHHKKNQHHGSDDEDSDGQSGKKNKDNHNHNAKTVTWSDNQGFHGNRGHGHHRRHKSPSLKDVVLRKLGLKDDRSDSDEDYGIRKKSSSKGGHGHHKGGHKGELLRPYTVNFGDQFHGGGFQKQYHLEDSNSHGKKGGGVGQVQGILKKSKNDDGRGSDDENHGHKNQGGGKGGNHHDGGHDSGKKNGQSNQQKQFGRSQSMDFRVRLCCDNCERKVRHALRNVDDIDHVMCDQYNNRVMVVGNAKLEHVLKRLRKVKKETQLWQAYK